MCWRRCARKREVGGERERERKKERERKNEREIDSSVLAEVCQN